MSKEGINIFGYGSLINKLSLANSVSNFSELMPARIFGYNRYFGVESSSRYDKKCEKFVSVLNLEKAEEKDTVNGVIFKVSFDQYQRLIDRELSYKIVEVDVYDVEGKNIIDKADTFISNLNDFSWIENSIPQQEYLDICKEGCSHFSEEFLNEFIDTTLYR